MIVEPTVKELLKHAENRYSLVIATARRARQIAKGDEAKVDSDDKSPVTLAANEIAEGKLKIRDNDDNYENEIEEQEKEEKQIKEQEERIANE